MSKFDIFSQHIKCLDSESLSSLQSSQGNYSDS